MSVSSSHGAVVLVTGDFVRTGGMDRANYALANFLALSGIQVELVAHRVDPELAAQHNVGIHNVAKPLNSYFLGQGLLAAKGRRVGKQVADAGGRVIVNGGNCRFADVNWVHYLHAAYCSPSSSLSAVRQLKRRVELPLNLRAERRALSAARFVICNSRRTQADAIEKIGVAPSKTHVVYYGNDATTFYPADQSARTALRERLGLPLNRPIATFIGALGDRRKGFDVLLAAWNSLVQTNRVDALLVVIGTGAELDAWRRRTAEAGLERHICYLGFRNDVADILRAADLLVAPTRYEAYGLGVQEALCCGTPAVVSAAAGVAERYPAELGDLLLADAENVSALADRLRHCLFDVDSLRRRCISFSDILRARTWDDMSCEIAHVVKLDQIRSTGESRQAVLKQSN